MVFRSICKLVFLTFMLSRTDPKLGYQVVIESKILVHLEDPHRRPALTASFRKDNVQLYEASCLLSSSDEEGFANSGEDADDTYIVIPASNVSSMAAQLDHVDRWAESNNLRLNRAKSVEIIFTDSKRKPTLSLPPPILDIRRVTSVKMLGITITNHLSVGDHVRHVIGKCAQSLYALKLLRNHGMSDDSLRHVYKVVVLSKLLYASPAWWGFTSAADKQRLEASIRRAVRSGLYTADDPSFSELVEDMDDNLFAKIRHNTHHVLYKLLPDKTDHSYNHNHIVIVFH